MSDLEAEAQAKLDAIAERRAARLAKAESERKIQEAKDEEAIEALLEQHGDHAITVIPVEAHKPGLPVRVAVLRPEGPLAKRFLDMSKKANTASEREAAMKQLTDASVVYPDEKSWEALQATFGGLVGVVAMAVANALNAKRIEEKKG